ncbi:hypothetical protein COCCADRAFT_113521 [Bipolaris zeicola 26-R-13]|uniref:Uncharacterized protein n=1 Tax=Cochliobolus carbonum (strain 26-R-13) TaxID=930089 RepID=W6XVD2_COCC2|nr:uncharacterized protein COCCADRAFT_113521 [Bipolaris zeicola 26-R-13]EUC26734.1 hypothetical protein COCCADRAFT_113521 [Bipolaris zeicola 26-R-13]
MSSSVRKAYPVRKAYQYDTAWDLVSKREDSLNEGKRLSDKKFGRLKRFHETTIDSKPARKLRLFLEELPMPYKLLCAIVFAQDSIYKTPDSVLQALITKTNARPSKLRHTGLQILCYSQITMKHGRDSSETWEQIVSPTYPKVKDVESVFCPEMAKKIKTCQVKGVECKKLVLRFPKSTNHLETAKAFPAFVDLEICEKYMGELVMRLFGVDVNRISDTELGFQMRHESGIMQNTSCLSLVEALRGRTLEVFGKEIHSAIAECENYKDEAKNKINTTTCVRAFWVEGEARIRLEMEAIAGVAISNKLLWSKQ